MPNKKISQLNSVDQLFGDEKLLITQSGANKTSTVPVLGTKLNSDVGAAVSGLNTQNSGYATAARNSIAGIGSDLAASIGALHRSPNAVTAMFVYDTSKDSDGGAWTEKCQHTSWYNEPLSGNWLGAQSSEIHARYSNASFGPELVSNGTFDSGISGWTTYGIPTSDMSWSNGTLKVTPSIYGWNRGVYTTIDVVPGSVLKISFSQNVSGGSWSSTEFNIGSGPDSYAYVRSFTSGNYFTVPAGVTKLWLNQNIFLNSGSAGNFLTLDNVSVRTVTAVNTSSSDYFQLTTDGKFYRLWKNRLRNTSDFSANWSSMVGGVLTLNAEGVSALLTGVTSGASGITQTNNSINDIVTFSLEAKPFGSPGQLQLRIGNADTARGLYTLSGAGTATVDYSPNTAVSITALADGYYRVTVTATSAGAFTNVEVRLYGSVGADRGYYIRNAQLESGVTFTSYEAKTTSQGVTEVFRGNKREFPKLSAIVAESSNVTIYDLTEPGRPMWMRFVKSGAAWDTSYLGVGNCTTISALNGTVAIGQGDEWGLRVVQFQKDGGFRISGGAGSANRELRDYTTPVVGRNSTVSTVPRIPLTYLNSSTLSGTINAVAMTVLPDAPVDPVTSLQVPTIAVATSGGVSVIKHNGTVVKNNYAGVFIGVQINKNLLTACIQNAGHLYYAYNPGSLQDNFTLAADTSTSAPDFNIGNATPNGLLNPTRSELLRRSSAASTVQKLKNFESDPAKSVAATLTNTFNTGHMIGDIRRAYLADVDAGSVSGTELVTNGTFETDTGWTKSGSVTWASGAYTISDVDGTDASIEQIIPTIVSGKLYRVEVVLSATGNIRLYFANNNYVTLSGTGTKTFYIRAVSGGSIKVGSIFTNISATIENISVQEAVADRSYKSQAANIAGTLTKSPVATNAQLVGYSGFSAANYLREPYSADLDFGTGEWSVGAWVNIPTTIPETSFGYASEITADGSFDFGIEAGWVPASSNTITWDSTNKFGIFNYINSRQWKYTFSSVQNKLYKVSFTFAGFIGSATWARFGPNADGSGGPAFYGTLVAGTTYTGYITASSASTTLTLAVGDNTSIILSDISIKEVISPISTVLARSHSAGASVTCGVNYLGNLVATAYDGTTTRTVTSPNAYNTGTWNKVRVNYTTDGKLALLVNGVEVASATGTALLTLNNSNAVLTIGNSYNLDAPFPGSLALLKLSATVPTTEQSQWMYEQEKAMFQPGAQVCLPSSNPVTDLTYDNLTDTWIAAQSTHISEWKGLVRTSYRKPASGSFDKLSAASGVRLMTRSSWGVDIEAQPVQLKKELFSSTDASINNQNTTTFDFDAVTSQTDFALPVGYTAQAVFSAGVQIFEGSTGNKFTRLFDGFKETIRFATAPGNGVWVKIRAVRAQG